jgi:mannose-6-phosphate isomerase-like protein (cupin superfamily)
LRARSTSPGEGREATGEFVWHHDDDEDELFLVVAGTLLMQFRDGDVRLGPGELIVSRPVSSTARAHRTRLT